MDKIQPNNTPLPIVKEMAMAFDDLYNKLFEAKQTLQREFPSQYVDWCQMPLAVTHAYLMVNYVSLPMANALCSVLAGCYLWRQYKVVYSVSESLSRELKKQSENLSDLSEIPSKFLIENMPFPCVYFYCPNIFDNVTGLLVWFECDCNTLQPELRVNMYSESERYMEAICLNLPENSSLADCFRATGEYTMKAFEKDATPELIEAVDNYRSPFANNDMTSIIKFSIQLLLYIMASNADVADNKDMAAIYTQSKIIRDRYKEIRQIDVGDNVSKMLNSIENEYLNSPSKKKSHIRCGHWHHFWTGPIDGDRKLILKWVSPTVINPQDAVGDTITTIEI